MMPSCKDLTENADAYLEGTLGWWDSMMIRTHLWMCRHCRAYVDQLRKTIAALGALPEPEGPPLAPEVKDELMESFRALKVGNPPSG